MNDFPLHQAAMDGDLLRACQLIEGGVSMDSRDEDLGRTPLHWAAARGRYGVAKLLIDRQCDLNPKDRRGYTPLWLAADRGEKSVVDLLIERGAGINCIDDNSKVDLLHFASHNGWSDVVLIILEKGEANLDAATESGGTPLMWATYGGQKDVAALLIRAGADVNRRDGFGKTPLHMAWASGHRDVVKLLLEAGADPNIKDNGGETALSVHLNQRNVSPEEIRLLVQHGAFFEEFDLVCISQKPLLKENVLKDAELCTQSVINKYHRLSLPTLYRNPYFARKLPNSDNFNLNAQQIEEVEKLVKCDIIRNTFCNVVKVCPMALSALCVLSLAALPRQA